SWRGLSQFRARLNWSTRHTWRRRTAQHSFGTQVLVHVWPMDAVATAGDLPVLSLCLSRIQQARIPGQRDDNRAAVHESDAQGVLSKPDSGHALVSRQRQDAHATPPKALPDGLEAIAESFAVPSGKIRNCGPSLRLATNTSPKNAPDLRGHGSVRWVRGYRSRHDRGRSSAPLAWRSPTQPGTSIPPSLLPLHERQRQAFLVLVLAFLVAVAGLAEVVGAEEQDL